MPQIRLDFSDLHTVGLSHAVLIPDNVASRALLARLQHTGVYARQVADSLNGFTFASGTEGALRILWNMGHKVPAIKLARELSGAGLKDAKDWCDANLRSVL